MKTRRAKSLAGLFLFAVVLATTFQNCSKAKVSIADVQIPSENNIAKGLDADITAPTVEITKAPPSYINKDNTLIEFRGQDNAGGPLSYECAVNNVALACPNLQANPTGLTEITHTFTVVAIDDAGNRSKPAQVSWQVDLTPPTVMFLNPLPADPSQFSSAIIKFIGQDAGSGIDHYECKLDGVLKNPCTSPQNSIVPEGQHVFEVLAWDRAGNFSLPAIHNWEYKKQGLVAPAQILGYTGAANQIDMRLDEYLATTSLGVHFTPVENAQKYVVEISKGGVQLEIQEGVGVVQDLHVRFDYPASNPAKYVHKQSYNVLITAINGAIMTQSPLATFIADLEGPVHVVTIPLGQPKIVPGQKDVKIGLSITDDVSGVESAVCQLTSGTSAPVESNCYNKADIEYKGLPYGKHVLKVSSQDRAGNKTMTVHNFETVQVVCDPFNPDPSNAECNIVNFPVYGSIYYVTPEERAKGGLGGVYNTLYKIVLRDDAQVKKAKTVLYLKDINRAPGPWTTGFQSSDGQTLQMENGEKLFEWFGLDLSAYVQLAPGEAAGSYEFAIIGDDGADLSLKRPGDADYVKMNSWEPVTSPRIMCPLKVNGTSMSVAMTAGLKFPMKVRWMQGPRNDIAIQVYWRMVNATNTACTDGYLPYANETSAGQTATYMMNNGGWKLLIKDNYSALAN